MKKIISSFIALCIIGIAAQANITMPKIFSDNMVLQRNASIPVWGWAAPNEKIEVRFNKQIKTTKAGKDGKWMLRLDNENAGGPYDLQVKGKSSIIFKNVLVGEVWVCSGQSNMEFMVAQSMNAAKEIAAADYPLIRHIKVSREIGSLPKQDIVAEDWKICDPATVGGFTAVGYFFAKRLYDSLRIPIGLIHSSWGGTNIETWISREAFESSDEFKEMIAGMPKINIDSLSALKVKVTATRIEKLQGEKLRSADTNLFTQLSFDDTKWPELNQPQLWEQQSIGDLDGVVWLRKTIVLSALDLTKPATLSLAKIDDDDITYVNGVKVGSTSQYDAMRNYTIAPGVLKEGKNIIAIRVADNGGGGGIWGDAADMKLVIGNQGIPLSGQWKFQVESIIKTTDQNSLPSLCYNAMISPLLPYACKGILWYQGESNAGRAYQYRTAFPLLINDWRKKWNNPVMPFYFVQLATYTTAGNSNEGCDWAELREAQTQTLQLPNTGMCVTTDVGNPSDIHPTNKKEVGSRLATVALNNLYQTAMVCNGPSYRSMEIKENEVILSFDNIAGGLFTADKYGYLKGFEIAGADKIFYYAKASIKNNTVIVSCDKVLQPLAVRFGWAGDDSECNLFNTAGFPAVPFRTDEWKTVTKDAKYKIEKLQ